MIGDFALHFRVNLKSGDYYKVFLEFEEKEDV